jgi:hypothetical protein
VTRSKGKPAHAAPRRTVSFTIAEGDYAGWAATAYADFKAKVASDLVSGDMDRVIRALDRVIISHNFPDGDDETVVAESIGDVDMTALEMIVDEVFDAIKNLPNR